MRIVGGARRGLKLEAGSGRDIRPTSERARAALFNILQHNGDLRSPVGARVLDVCAGTGALGLEAQSRGAAAVTFIEKSRAACALIRRNAAACGIDRPDIRPCDATAPGPAPQVYDLILIDPPYADGLAGPILAALAAGGWCAPGAVIAVEIASGDRLAPPAGYSLIDDRRYGAARLLLLRYGNSL